MTPEDQKRKRLYLQKHIFHGLDDLNSGFDAATIPYFHEVQFEIVLNRAKDQKIGIYGIEPHIRNENTGEMEYFAVDTFENYKTYPQNSEWYFKAFEKFKNTGEKLLYSASFYVGANYFEFEEE